MIDDDDKVSQFAKTIWDTIETKTVDQNRRRALCEVIQIVANDPLLAPSVILRGAKAADKDEERVEQLCYLLARFSLARDRREVRSAAGYLGSSIKRLVMSWGESWTEERPSLRGKKR